MLTECQPQRRRRPGRSVRSRPAGSVCARRSLVHERGASASQSTTMERDVCFALAVSSSSVLAKQTLADDGLTCSKQLKCEVLRTEKWCAVGCAVGHGDRDRRLMAYSTRSQVPSRSFPIAAPSCFHRHHLCHFDHCFWSAPLPVISFWELRPSHSASTSFDTLLLSNWWCCGFWIDVNLIPGDCEFWISN
jgi:hypothetical protein